MEKGFYNSKLYWTLSYFSFAITGCISISALIGIPIGVTSSAVGLKSISQKLRKKNMINDIFSNVLVSKTLIDSNISHDEFVLMNNVRK